MNENKTPVPRHIIFIIFLALLMAIALVGKIAYWLAWVSIYEFTIKDSEAQIKLLEQLLKEKEDKVKQEVKKPVLVPKKVVESTKIDKPHVETTLDKVRQERKVICQEVYEKLKDKVINHKNVVERCATMMTLQYAYESGHGKSLRCTKGNNCFWIKHNKRDRCIRNTDWFCTFKSQKEWSYDYAEMFYKHYEGYRSIEAYLHAYSPDGNKSYHSFVKSKYNTTLKYFLK